MLTACSDLFIRFGGHTEHHTYLTTIPMEQIEDEVRENREKLSEWTGSAIEHFCMPGGAYTEEMLPTLYRNFRTLRTADTMNFHNPDRTFIRPTFHFYPRGKISMLGNALRHKSYDAFFYVLTHLTTGYFDILRRLIRRYEDKDVDIVIWGHSWEIAELGLFPELEKLFHYLHIKYADKIVDYETLTSENK